MAPNTRRALGALLSLFAALTCVGTARAGGATRPIVMTFAGTVNPTGGGTSSHKGDDDITSDARTRAGTLAFNFCLADSGAVIAIRYDPKLPMVMRAILENHISVLHPEDPTPDERLKIAKAMGAVYLVTVSTLLPHHDVPANTSAIEMSIVASEVTSRKEYTDHIEMASTAVRMRGNPTADGDYSNALRHFSGNDRLDNVLQSAANTLVLRLLGGPLREFARTAAPRELTPESSGQAQTSPDVIRPSLPIHQAQPTTPATPDSAPQPATPTTPAPATPPAIPTVTPDVEPGRAPAPATPPATPPTVTPAAVPAQPAAPTTPVVTTPVVTTPAVTTPPVTTPANLPTAATTITAGAESPARGPEKLVLPPVGGGSSVYDAAGRTFAATDEEAHEAIRQSAALLSDGDANEAIMMLRQEIDRQPLSPALRIALAKTYIGANRNDDAESEARRALVVLPAITPTTLGDLTGLLTKAISGSDNAVQARSTYEKIAADRPDATWARNALAQLDINEGRPEEAEAQYHSVLTAEPTNIVAARGLAQLRILHGDLPGAQSILAGLGTGPDANAARYEVILAVFDAGTTDIASRLTQNRAAWEAKSLSNEAIFNATNSQTTRIATLLTLLQSVTPAAAGRPEADVRSYRRRVLAANLLNQAAAAQIRLIQKGDADAASEVTIDLDQFQQTLLQAQGK